MLEDSKLQKLSRRLTGFAVSCGLSRLDAEDCAQETALLLAQKYPDKDEADAVPIAFRILRWKISEWRRRPASLVERNSVSLEEINPETDRGGDIEELTILRESVYRALESLGSNCRKLLLWQLEGHSGDEIARKLGLSTRNAAYIAINRCKSRFRKQYEAIQGRSPGQP